MSEEWEGALETLAGDEPQTQQAQPQATPAPRVGGGAPRETEIQPGVIPDGVSKDSGVAAQDAKAPDAKPADAGKRRFFQADDIPDDDEPKQKDEPQAAKAKGKDGIAQLREQYELTKSEKAKLEAKVQELERTREEGTKAEIAKATEELRKQIEDIRKARDESEQELRFARYTKSAEYKEKYETPLRDAYQQAIDDIKGVQVVDVDGGEPRQATFDELRPILEAASAAEAAQKAAEIFGSAAPIVIQHRNEILRLQKAARVAIDDYTKRGAEREKAAEAERAQKAQQTRTAWETSLKAVEAERPLLYGRPKDDDALGKAWDKGDQLVKVAFLGEMPPEAPGDIDKEAFVVEAQAEVAARVRGFNVMAHRNVALKQEVARLKAELAKVTGSEPGQSSSKGDGQKGPSSWEEKLMAL